MALWRLSFVLLFSYLGVEATYLMIRNRCEVSLWPGILANSGKPQIWTGGFLLPPQYVATFRVPSGWSGRIWARSGCTFDLSGRGNCATGDCGGVLQCNGAGGVPPATLAEINLDNPTNFYDISLVDGFNVPISIVPSITTCPRTECVADLNSQCRPELRVVSNGTVVACKSACLAFGKPEYCCTGDYNSPNTCKPSVYSSEFKAACPRAYSYAFDDPSSTFTCQGANYSVIFC